MLIYEKNPEDIEKVQKIHEAKKKVKALQVELRGAVKEAKKVKNKIKTAKAAVKRAEAERKDWLLLSVGLGKAEYDELIATRIKDLSLPEEQRSMTNAEFVKKAKLMEKVINRWKTETGIHLAGEAFLCNKCLRSFIRTKRYKTLTGTVIFECADHAGDEPIPVKYSLVGPIFEMNDKNILEERRKRKEEEKEETWA